MINNIFFLPNLSGLLKKLWYSVLLMRKELM